MSYAYYRFFPGDYIRDTIHLGWLEDCAYRRLIDLYHLHGRPIRNDRAYIMRAVRAAEPEQQAAVDTVLTEFFELSTDGWHQKRCDAEITYRTSLSEQAKRAVNARWNKQIDTDAIQPHNSRITNQNQNQNQKKQFARDALSNPKSKPPAIPVDWWSDEPKTNAAGQTLGLHARPGESWFDYRARIRTELDRQRISQPDRVVQAQTETQAVPAPTAKT